MTKEVLGFSICPHELRHSSVTYFVQKFGLKDIAGFYYRYGWSFGSPEAKPYIDEHLIGGDLQQEEVVKAIESGRVEALEKKLAKLRLKFSQTADILDLMLKANGKEVKIPTKLMEEFREID